jgi:hypothetical protein
LQGKQVPDLPVGATYAVPMLRRWLWAAAVALAAAGVAIPLAAATDGYRMTDGIFVFLVGVAAGIVTWSVMSGEL